MYAIFQKALLRMPFGIHFVCWFCNFFCIFLAFWRIVLMFVFALCDNFTLSINNNKKTQNIHRIFFSMYLVTVYRICSCYDARFYYVNSAKNLHHKLNQILVYYYTNYG